MIRGERIILRTVREADLDFLYSAISDIDNRGEFIARDIFSEIDFRNQFLKHGFWEENEGFLLICVDDKIIGRIGYSKTIPYFNGLELWYMIFDPKDWKKGYTSEAVRIMVKYLFSIRPINRLQILTDSNNEASRQVAKKCGFTFEGTARGALFRDGEHHSQDIFSIIRSEVELR